VRISTAVCYYVSPKLSSLLTKSERSIGRSDCPSVCDWVGLLERLELRHCLDGGAMTINMCRIQNGEAVDLSVCKPTPL
jgi:hypothetical protein